MSDRLRRWREYGLCVLLEHLEFVKGSFERSTAFPDCSPACSPHQARIPLRQSVAHRAAWGPERGTCWQNLGARSPQTLSQDERRIVAAWAADCAERVLEMFEAEALEDTSPRDAMLARGPLLAATSTSPKRSGD